MQLVARASVERESGLLQVAADTRMAAQFHVRPGVSLARRRSVWRLGVSRVVAVLAA